MKIGQYNIKKRYIIGGLLVVWILSKCTGGDEQQQVAYQPQPTPAPQQYDDVPPPQQQQYAAPAGGAPVTIVNTPAQQGDSGSGFFHGLLTGHLLSNHIGGGRGSDYQNNSRRTVINKTVNNYHPAPAPQATAPQKYGPTTAYNSQPPAQPTYKTWSTSKSKGWGSNSYKYSKPSYSYSKSSSFARSSSRSRRR